MNKIDPLSCVNGVHLFSFQTIQVTNFDMGNAIFYFVAYNILQLQISMTNSYSMHIVHCRNDLSHKFLDFWLIKISPSRICVQGSKASISSANVYIPETQKRSTNPLHFHRNYIGMVQDTHYGDFFSS